MNTFLGFSIITKTLFSKVIYLEDCISQGAQGACRILSKQYLRGWGERTRLGRSLFPPDNLTAGMFQILLLCSEPSEVSNKF